MGALTDIDDEFLDYGDDYDDEEYGAQGHGARGQYYYQAAGAHGIDASGGSNEYEEEDDGSDESGILR